MIRRAIVVALVLFALPSLAAAQPALDDTQEVTHYYQWTLAADALSLGTLVAGALAEGHDKQVSDALYGVSALQAMFVTPIIHASRGHIGRALGSYAMRAGLAGVGVLLTVTLASCDSSKKFLCELDYIGPGAVAGFVVASVLDAAFLTRERRPRGTVWTPQVSASRDGARFGIAAAF